MEIIIVEDDKEIGQTAGKIILQKLVKKPNLILGLATGSSPVSTYEYLVADYQKNNTNWSKVTTFNLDEYIGLNEEHLQSYHYFMNQHLFQYINITHNQINIPSGIGNYEEFAKQYDQKIANAGGIDLQLLGIGVNGHIGFNEPMSAFDSQTRIVDLTPSTISANARFFASPQEVPKQAISMGLKSIMQAKEILLLASGKNKAQAIKHLINGKKTTEWPCTILQDHPNVTVILDTKAAELL